MSAAPIHLQRRGLMFVLSSPSGAGKSTLARLLLDGRPGPQPVDLGHHAAAASERGRWPALSLHRQRRPSSACASTASCWNPRRCTAISTERRARRWRRRSSPARTCSSTSIGRAPNSCRARMTSGAISFASSCSRRTSASSKARLERRAEDAPETIRRRLENARKEIGKWSMYDYIIVNEDLDRSFPMARAILAAERLRRERLVGLQWFRRRPL